MAIRSTPKSFDLPGDAAGELDPRVLGAQQTAIGLMLQDLYDGIAAEPVPPEIASLLGELRHRSPQQSN